MHHKVTSIQHTMRRIKRSNLSEVSRNERYSLGTNFQFITGIFKDFNWKGWFVGQCDLPPILWGPIVYIYQVNIRLRAKLSL